MKQFGLNLDSFVFPQNKKARYNGKVLSKFDVAYYLDVLQPSMRWTIIYDVYTYVELVGILQKRLSL